MYYTYVLESLKSKELYIGQSSNLKQRLKAHNAGKSKHTSKNKPYILIFYLAFIVESDSKRFERYLKSGYGRRFLKNSIKDYLNTQK